MVPTIDTGGIVNFKSIISGPVRYSTLYSTIEYTDNLISQNRTTYVWTTFDEQIDLCINYKQKSNKNIADDLKTKGLLLPFRCSNTPNIDKIGTSYIQYSSTSDIDSEAKISRNYPFIIRKNDPNHIYMISTRTPELRDVNITINISYFRDITDIVDNLQFFDNNFTGYDNGNVVYFKANDPCIVSFFTTESINRFYLKNKVRLVFDQESVINYPAETVDDHITYSTSIRGVQTMWDIEVNATLIHPNTSLGFLRGEIDLFDQTYTTSNRLCIIDSNITMNVTSVSTIDTIKLTFSNIDNSGVYHLPYDLYVELTNKRYNSNNVFTFNSSNIDTEFSHIFDGFIYNTTYLINVYVIDYLQRTIPIHVTNVITTMDGYINKPQIIDVLFQETISGILFSSNVYYYETADSSDIHPFSLYYLITPLLPTSSNIIDVIMDVNDSFLLTKDSITPYIQNNIVLQKNTIETFYITIIATPSINDLERTNNLAYMGIETRQIIIQSVLESNIRNAIYHPAEDLYYARSIANVYYDIELSSSFQTKASLGMYNTTFSGNIIQFSGNLLYTEPLYLEVDLLSKGSYKSSQGLVMDPELINPGEISFETTDYQYYKLYVGNVTTGSHMKYVTSIEFNGNLNLNSDVILDNNTSFSNATEVEYDKIYIPNLPLKTMITGNILFTDRLGDTFKYPFQLETTGLPDIQTSWIQQDHFIHINANIVNHTAFDTWNGNIRWFVDEQQYENAGSNNSATFIIPISVFENPRQFHIKANVEHSILELSGYVEANIYGIHQGNNGIIFDKPYYGIESNINVSFNVLQSDVDYMVFTHYVQLFHKSSNDKLTNAIKHVSNVEDTTVNISFPTLSDRLDFPSLVGEMYANVTSYFGLNLDLDEFASQITYTSINTSILDQNPVSDIHSYITLNDSDLFELWINNIIDDTIIPHHISVFMNDNSGEWIHLTTMSNITVESNFPMKVFELSNLPNNLVYDSESSVIRYTVTDYLRSLSPKTFYFPNTFKHRLYDTTITYDLYNFITERFTSNIQGTLFNSDQFTGNVLLDYTFRASNISQSITGNIIVSSEDSNFVIHESFLPDVSYQVNLQIHNQFDETIGLLYARLPNTSLVAKTPFIELEGNILVLPQFGIDLTNDNLFVGYQIDFINCSLECDHSIAVMKGSRTEYLRNHVNDRTTMIVLANVSDVYDHTYTTSIYPFWIYIQDANVNKLQMKIHSMSIKHNETQKVHLLTTQDMLTAFNIGFHFIGNADGMINQSFLPYTSITIENLDVPTSSNL
jgi:hypothetical protein